MRHARCLGHLEDLGNSPSVGVVAKVHHSNGSGLVRTFTSCVLRDRPSTGVVSVSCAGLTFRGLGRCRTLRNCIRDGALTNSSGCLVVSRIRVYPSFRTTVGSLRSDRRCSVCLANSGTFLLDASLTALFANHRVRVPVCPFDFGRCYYCFSPIISLCTTFSECMVRNNVSNSCLCTGRGSGRRCVERMFGAVLAQSLARGCGLSSARILLRLTRCVVSGVDGAASPGGVTNMLASGGVPAARMAVNQCVGVLYRTFIFCGTSQCSVQKGGCLRSLGGCCLTSANFECTLLNREGVS